VRTAGIVLITLAALGPAAWPWYFTWGIALIACDPRLQRSTALVIGVVLGSLVIKPDGILALPYGSAPVVMALYLAIGIASGTVLHRRRTRPGSDRHRVAATTAGTA
jgi:hypothetical protein